MVGKKRALVCGAGGFIGSHLVTDLKKRGYWVRGVDLKLPEFKTTDADDFQIADLRVLENCQNAMEGNFDEVMQLAADMGGAGYIFTKEHDADVMHNSALINLHMAKLASLLNVGKIFYSSSACIYPDYNQTDPNNPNCSEDTAYPANPDSCYGWEKLCSEQMYLAFHRNYKLNVRIARFHNIFGECFDEKTEILTENGFKFFKDVTFEHNLATRNPETGLVEFQRPLAIQNYEHKGMMYKILTSDMDMVITPDHSIYVSTCTTKSKMGIETKIKTPFQLKKMKDVIQSRIFFRSDFNFQVNDAPEYFYLPEIKMKDQRKIQSGKGLSKKIPINIWMDFLGWYLSEGSCFQTPTNYTVAITQFDKLMVNTIITCIKKMGFTCHHDGKSIIISSKQLWDYCKQFGHAHDKFIPREFLNLKKESLEVLFNSLMLGDGGHKYKFKKSFKYSTASIQLASDVQELALKLGYNAWIRIEKSHGCTATTGKYYDKDYTCYRVHICKSTIHTIKKHQITQIDYVGSVYDVTVPNHIIFVRRNGKCVWSGNCGSWNNGKEKAPAAMCRKVAETPEGGTMEIWGPGTQTRSFLFIEECLEAIRHLMDSDFIGPVNIGSEEMISINNLAKLAMDIAGKNLEIKNIPGPLGVMGRNSDNRLIREKLGWAPSKPLRYGMEKLYSWINEQVKNDQNHIL